jgi:catechol 2,3-dioxygenase-like lactoylglutathione lyase family enzyme
MADFELQGVHHLALVSTDMARTVRFYRDTLGLKLVRTIELPFGGQHFFFDIGQSATLAFFWFPKRADAVPGVSSPRRLPGQGNFTSAPGSMNHVAFSVPAPLIDEYRDRLVGRGIECSEIMNHDDSDTQMSAENHPGVWLRSIYFWDPDGALLEFAAWTRPLSADDVSHAPVDKLGNHVEGMIPSPSATGQGEVVLA